MIVSGQDTDASSTLPVPNPDCLIVRGTQDPWVLVMKNGRSDVVQVTEESENTSSLLVVPNFYLVVVTAGYEERLLVVEAYATNWTIVFVKFIEEGAHSIVPQLDDAIVQAETKYFIVLNSPNFQIFFTVWLKYL